MQEQGKEGDINGFHTLVDIKVLIAGRDQVCCCEFKN